MESSWRWNAWWAGGSIGPWIMVARLLNPILGREYVGFDIQVPPRLVVIMNLDASLWSYQHLNVEAKYDYGFPYQYEVDQHEFP